MCDYCNNIRLVSNFITPEQYEQTIEYVQQLISKMGFVFISGNCELGDHKKNNGWIDDVIWHEIKCPKCGQIFSIVVNAYRGQGVAGKLLNLVVEDCRSKGISPLYLITDHTSFYERYGWEFLCMAQGDGEPDMARMYIHR